MTLFDLYYLYYEYNYEIIIDLIYHDMIFGIISTGKDQIEINLVNHDLMKIINYFEGGDKNEV